MAGGVTRRDALRVLGTAGVATLLPDVVFGRQGDVRIGGLPVEIVVGPAPTWTGLVNPSIVRVSVRPIRDGRTIPIADHRIVSGEADQARAAVANAPASTRVGNLEVSFTASPPTLQISAGGRTVQRLSFDEQTPAMRFALPKGPLLGFGEGGAGFDRKGTIDPMRNGQVTYTQPEGKGGYSLRTHGARVGIPWLIGTDGWAVYVHQPQGTFDLSGDTALFTPRAADLAYDIFVVAANEPAAIMRAWADLTGYPEMPPLWSFGYLQSSRTLGGHEEILRVARTFREKQLPCDALIFLGTEFAPSGWNTRNGEFSWKPENFPDPPVMLKALHDQDFKVVLHVVVEGRVFTGTVNDPCTAPELPPGRTADDRWPPERQVACYWPAHKSLADLGVDGWWPDQGDGYDPSSRLARIRMYWEGTQQWRPDERVFALHRNGQAGMQRYGAFLWSGDVFSFWETLRRHIPIAINTALSGVPYWGTDIGGFVPTKEYTGELHVRWFQFGAFTPLFRAHGRAWHLRLPWGWNTGTVGVSEIRTETVDAMEPPESELRNPHVEPICRKYLELRYQLMPYLYTRVRECADTGMPILRALWLHYPDDPRAVAREDVLLWGRDILVAPVVEQGATSRRLYLPRGRWYDWWTNEAIQGGREITRAVDLETMPLYVRAGAVIPTTGVAQTTEQSLGQPLTLTVYPGADGEGTVFEDDGRTFAYRRGDWFGLTARWDDRASRLTLSSTPGSRPPATPRPVTVRVISRDARRAAIAMQVEFTGRPVTVQMTVTG